MSYMVIFRTPEGKPGYQQADGVQQAVETVERLRNQDGVENVRIFRMEEVAFEYKVHYTVEIKDPAVGSGAAASALDSGGVEETVEPAPAAPAPTEAPTVDALSWDDDEDEPATGSGRAPFDQMAAIDPNGTPPWGGAESDEGDQGDASAARRGLFGR